VELRLLSAFFTSPLTPKGDTAGEFGGAITLTRRRGDRRAASAARSAFRADEYQRPLTLPCTTSDIGCPPSTIRATSIASAIASAWSPWGLPLPPRDNLLGDLN